MTDNKWRPYPDTMPQLPIDSSKPSQPCLVTLQFDDGSHRVDVDRIRSDGTWVKYSGKPNVIAWMYLPAPYYRIPDQEALF